MCLFMNYVLCTCFGPYFRYSRCCIGSLWIEHIITYEVLLLCFKCLNGKDPAYLKTLLIPYKHQCELHSSSANLLVEPKTATITYGERAFSVVAPRMWKRLPTSVKHAPSFDSFKCSLKTHLFKNAYPD